MNKEFYNRSGKSSWNQYPTSGFGKQLNAVGSVVCNLLRRLLALPHGRERTAEVEMATGIEFNLSIYSISLLNTHFKCNLHLVFCLTALRKWKSWLERWIRQVTRSHPKKPLKNAGSDAILCLCSAMIFSNFVIILQTRCENGNELLWGNCLITGRVINFEQRNKKWYINHC